MNHWQKGQEKGSLNIVCKHIYNLVEEPGRGRQNSKLCRIRVN